MSLDFLEILGRRKKIKCHKVGSGQIWPPHLWQIRCGKSEAEVTNRRLRSTYFVLLKLTTYRHETSRGLSATAGLLVQYYRYNVLSFYNIKSCSAFIFLHLVKILISFRVKSRCLFIWTLFTVLFDNFIGTCRRQRFNALTQWLLLSKDGNSMRPSLVVYELWLSRHTQTQKPLKRNIDGLYAPVSEFQ